MSITFPGESAEYRAARDRLLEQEIELRRAMEAVAAARRELPPGGVVPEDYVFQGAGADGAPTDVRLSELFAPGKDSLVIYSFMFPRDPGDERPGPAAGQTALLPLAEGPCPSCVALLDQLDGAAEHASQHVNLAVVAKSPLPRILTFAEERGWRRLRLLSSAGNTYNRDYLGETAEGAQRPMLNVFHRDGETIRHFWGSELFYAPTDPGQDPRHVGTLEPVWNLFDLTREGRPPDWDEQLSYRKRAADGVPTRAANTTKEPLMTDTTSLVTGVDFITMPTRDFAAAVEFYGTVLGLPCSAEYDRVPGAEFETGTLTLQVIDAEAIGREFRPHAFPIALHVEDVDARPRRARVPRRLVPSPVRLGRLPQRRLRGSGRQRPHAPPPLRAPLVA